MGYFPATAPAPYVECPACKGDGSIDESVSLTSNPHVTCDVTTHTCGFCKGRGTVPEDQVEDILDELEDHRGAF